MEITTTDGNKRIVYPTGDNTGDVDEFLYEPDMIEYIKEGEQQIREGKKVSWREIKCRQAWRKSG